MIFIVFLYLRMYVYIIHDILILQIKLNVFKLSKPHNELNKTT